MPTLCELAGRHAQRQLLLVEGDDEQLERHARDFLLLDADDPADAVSRIDDELVGLEAMALADRLLLRGHQLTRGRGLLGDRLRCRGGWSGDRRHRRRQLRAGWLGDGGGHGTLGRLSCFVSRGDLAAFTGAAAAFLACGLDAAGLAAAGLAAGLDWVAAGFVADFTGDLASTWAMTFFDFELGAWVFSSVLHGIDWWLFYRRAGLDSGTLVGSGVPGRGLAELSPIPSCSEPLRRLTLSFNALTSGEAQPACVLPVEAAARNPARRQLLPPFRDLL